MGAIGGEFYGMDCVGVRVVAARPRERERAPRIDSF
jgi:hypothetical protein